MSKAQIKFSFEKYKHQRDNIPNTIQLAEWNLEIWQFCSDLGRDTMLDECDHFVTNWGTWQGVINQDEAQVSTVPPPLGSIINALDMLPDQARENIEQNK